MKWTCNGKVVISDPSNLADSGAYTGRTFLAVPGGWECISHEGEDDSVVVTYSDDISDEQIIRTETIEMSTDVGGFAIVDEDFYSARTNWEDDMYDAYCNTNETHELIVRGECVGYALETCCDGQFDVVLRYSEKGLCGVEIAW